AGALAPDASDLGHFAADTLDALPGELDRAAARQALPWLRGARRPGDDDGVAEPLLADLDLLVEPLAEGEEQGHRGGAPDDAEEGQEEPQLLRPDVPQELPQIVAKVHWVTRPRAPAAGSPCRPRRA